MTAEWVRVELDAVEKFGADGAVVLGLIAYRCNDTGEWLATVADLVHETRLTDHRVRSAVRVLRDAGAVHSHRADRFRPTLTWTVFAGHAVNGKSPVTRLGNPTLPVTGKSPVTSSQEVQEVLVGLEPHLEPAFVEPVEPTTKRSRKRPATAIPDDFRPTDKHWTLARSLGVDLALQGPQFVDYHRSKDSRFADWDAALRTWIRKAAEWAARDTPAAGDALPPPPKRDLYG